MKELQNELLEVRKATSEDTVTISLARYEELVRKEHLIDIMKTGVFYLSNETKTLLGVNEGDK